MTKKVTRRKESDAKLPNKIKDKNNEEKSIAVLRHAEYYGMVEKQDDLYSAGKAGIVQTNLMDDIFSRDNILMAYRNIKSNDGSNTPGVDGKTIKDIELLSVEEVVENVRKIVYNKNGYTPKPVRRKEIEKPNEGMRPLGIPCIWDRLIQQCIRQILEPYCEAKFSDNSFGFRPARSAENAIAHMYKHMQITKLYHVVEIDIKSFFDEVNHSKLMKQLWTLGIQDKKLLWIIKKILKAPIRMQNGETIYPSKGTPQGGIISPLLANIVLNELDQWVDSQWQENPIVYKYKGKTNKNGSFDKGHGYRAMKNTNLKEMYIIRYADDICIMCRNRSDALKVKIAVEQWLKERLKLQISPQKTRVIDARKSPVNFLGFEIKLHRKGSKWTVVSHMCDKAKKRADDKLAKQARHIIHPRKGCSVWGEINLFNAMVMGIQNYYRMATHINDDCHGIGRHIDKILVTGLESPRGTRLKRVGRQLTKAETQRYGESKMLRFEGSTKEPIYPIAYVQHKRPLLRIYGANCYTVEGRMKIHHILDGINMNLLQEVRKQSAKTLNIKYADNRLSKFTMQLGKCSVTKHMFVSLDEMACHHINPREFGGDDSFDNIVWLWVPVHKLIHATQDATILKYLEIVKPSKDEIDKINAYRTKANNNAITI